MNFVVPKGHWRVAGGYAPGRVTTGIVPRNSLEPRPGFQKSRVPAGTPENSGKRYWTSDGTPRPACWTRCWSLATLRGPSGTCRTLNCTRAWALPYFGVAGLTRLSKRRASPRTAGYCQARSRLARAPGERVLREIAGWLEKQVLPEQRWQGRRVCRSLSAALASGIVCA